jgi:hypothetical protein
MLRDRYARYNLFDAVPQLRLGFEPALAALDRLLDDDRLFWHFLRLITNAITHVPYHGARTRPRVNGGGMDVVAEPTLS